jgi:hypothetical protein
MTIGVNRWYRSARPDQTYAGGPFEVVQVAEGRVYGYDPERRTFIGFAIEHLEQLTEVEPPDAIYRHDVVALPASSPLVPQPWTERRCLACGIVERWAAYVSCRRIARWRERWEAANDELVEAPIL